MKTNKKYTHLFFDLDKTLWDFDANSRETLFDLFQHHHLTEKGIYSFDDFHESYVNINRELWEKYRNGIIDKSTLSFDRFYLSLKECGIDDADFATQFSAAYVDGVSEKTRLFPDVHETLDYLHGCYRMHVITNGFMEVQYRKMETSGLEKYFDHIITSEEVGSHKPALKIFQYALEKAGALASESIMIGDDPVVDMIGAKSAGIDQLFVNYEGMEFSELFTYQIRSLKEIRNIL